MNAIVKLRFEAIDYLTSEQSLERIEDVSILGAKILAQVIGDNSKRDFDKLIATSRRILDLEPDNVTAAEYWVQGAYLKLISTSDTEAINQFEVASREISERFPNSPLAFESLMAVARERKDFGMIRKLVDEKKEVGLDSNVLSYHLAWVSFLEGRDEESKSHLNEILQQNPEDVRAKMSMESLIRDEAVSKETREQEVPFSDNLGSFKYSIALGPAKN
ncbi:MAG: hypothetical protein EB078_05085 [Proteobacteria bacterium]|nr:hypothetical protein [Pseudomonadota bacterium]NDC25158.1 hypothetical protein [Pseudomonadota bacterium]NDD04259.1 hypothetical protein [Pseudomonadota bacterium]NDG26781.1 hypothetical protein [Pseudomonadota bacterium]